MKKIKSLLSDLDRFISFLENDFDFSNDFAFDKIYLWLEKNAGEECMEYIVSMMM